MSNFGFNFHLYKTLSDRCVGKGATSTYKTDFSTVTLTNKCRNVITGGCQCGWDPTTPEAICLRVRSLDYAYGSARDDIGGIIKKKSLKFNNFKDFGRVPSRIRTDDIQNHNLTL